MTTKTKGSIADTRKVNDILKRLHTAKSAANSNLMTVGQCLVELRAEYDSAEAFIEKAIAETGYARTTIYSYMTIYKDWKGKPDLVDRFDFKALEALAKESTPDAAVAKAAKAASRGKLISAQMAREIIAECSKNGQADDASDCDNDTSAVRSADEPSPARRETPKTTGKRGSAFDPDTTAIQPPYEDADDHPELIEPDDGPDEPEPPKPRRAVLPEIHDSWQDGYDTIRSVAGRQDWSKQAYDDALMHHDDVRAFIVKRRDAAI